MATTALINIDVDNLERGVAFYTAAFHLQIARRLGPSVFELLRADAPIYPLEKPATSPAGPATQETRRYARRWPPVHLDFVVPISAPR